MATINNYLGDITGKIGGLVFQKNKQGSIIRMNVKNSKTFSPASSRAKTNFSQSARGWSALNIDDVASWNYYGTTNFRGRNFKIGKAYSGFNSWVALRNAQLKMSILEGETKLYALTLVTQNCTPLKPSKVPPSTLNPGVITNIAHDAVSINMIEAQSTPDGQVRAVFNYTPENYSEFLQFMSPDSSRKYGIAIFGGMPNQKSVKQVQQLCFTGLIEVVSGWQNNINSFYINFFPNPVNRSRFKNGYTTGQTVIYTAYLVSNKGEYSLCGSVNGLVVDDIT